MEEVGGGSRSKGNGRVGWSGVLNSRGQQFDYASSNGLPRPLFVSSQTIASIVSSPFPWLKALNAGEYQRNEYRKKAYSQEDQRGGGPWALPKAKLSMAFSQFRQPGVALRLPPAASLYPLGKAATLSRRRGSQTPCAAREPAWKQPVHPLQSSQSPGST